MEVFETAPKCGRIAECNILKETALIDDNSSDRNFWKNNTFESKAADEEILHVAMYLNLESARETSLIDDEGVAATEDRPINSKPFQAALNETFTSSPIFSKIARTEVATKGDETDDADSTYLSMFCSGDTSDSDPHGTLAHTDTTKTVTFQDIESDFFEEEDDGFGKHKAKSPTPRWGRHVQELDSSTSPPWRSAKISESSVLLPQPKPPCDERKPAGTEDKTLAMSTVLLRSTINELHNALSSTNRLLAERDEEIACIRTRNAELKIQYDQVSCDCSQLREENVQLQVENKGLREASEAEKECIRREKDLRIIELSNQLLILSGKLDALESSQIRRRSSEGAESSPQANESFAERRAHTRQLDEGMSGRGTSCRSHTKAGGLVEGRGVPGFDCVANPCRNDMQCNEKPLVILREKRDSGKLCQRPVSMFVAGDGSAKNTRNKLATARDPDRTQREPDEDTQRDLQVQLRMKFMRDAFFYYMIGFHPDEQISAILAILDYGDRRQDFVLEAHKMRMLGKKFNASKVSSRGLTFVQTEFRS